MDLINRQDAITAIKTLHDLRNRFSDTYDKACIIGALEEVPSAQQKSCEYWDTESNYCALNRTSAQPEQSRGKWIKNCNVAFYWKCSECGSYLICSKEDYLLRENDYPNYCPNCGADMREVDNGNLH